MKNKQIPNNFEAEQSILSALLCADEQIKEDIFLKIDLNDFFNTQHQQLFLMMKTLYKKGSGVDFVTIADAFSRKNQLEEIGGLEYLTNLTNVIFSYANYESYLTILKDSTARRDLIKASEKLIKNAYDGIKQDVLTSQIQNDIEKITNGQIKQDYENISVIAEDTYQDFQKKVDGTLIEKEISTGFTNLDYWTNYLKGGQLIGLGARPGVGKTTFALNIANFISLYLHKNCLIFSLEQTKKEIFKKLLSLNSRIKSVDLDRKNELGKSMKKIEETTEKIKKAKLYIDDSFLTVEEIVLKARKMKRTEGLDFIIIDYLQLMPHSNYKLDRRLQIGDISITLKRLAKELDIPILLLSQLSRRTDSAVPLLSDFKESGDIEANLDIALSLYEDPSNPQQDDFEKKELLLSFMKHRGGPKVTIRYILDGAISKFSENEAERRQKVEPGKQEILELSPIALKEADEIFGD